MPVTPPILRVRTVAVEKLDDDVWRTVTVFPLFTVPAAEVNAPPLIEYWQADPLQELIETGAAALMPVTVMVFDDITVFTATFV